MAYKSTFLKRELVIDEIITIHYFEYMKDFVFAGEAHDFWEFTYLDKGELRVQADDRVYQLHPGDIIFHKPNEFHALQATGNKSPNLVVISFRCDSACMKFFKNKSCTLDSDGRRMISNIISVARSTFSTPLHIPTVEEVVISPDAPFGSEQLILLYLETFLILVKRHHLEPQNNLQHTKTQVPLNVSSASSRLEQIIQYMGFRICEQLTVDDLCNEFSISRSTLHSMFHKEQDCGAIDYFNWMKIERSKEIIRDNTMNFTEIAYYLSYSSLQYFSKQFKKATGMSPFEYSKSVKKYSHLAGTPLQKAENSTPPPRKIGS